MAKIDAGPLATLLACLEGKPPRDVDWPDLLTVANQALVTGVLAARIGDGVPEEVRAFLRTIHARALARNARLKRQLEEATASLNTVGIQPLLLKGAAVLNTAGSGYGTRILSDLDLMVPAHSMAMARRRLEAIGYRLHLGEDNPLAAMNLCREQDVGMIDLHCRTKTRYPGFDFEDLVGDCAEVRLGMATAWLPSPTSQALILLLHDQLQDRDYWRGFVDLRHLLDIAELARAPGGIDWEWLAAHFPRGHPRNAFDVQLATFALLFGAPVPVPQRRIWTGFQLRRRIVQLRLPGLRQALTVLTLLLDPPWPAGRMTAGRRMLRGTSAVARVRHALSVLKRFLARRNPGKI